MNFADLHCDTAGECFNRKKKFYSNDLHISLEKAAAFNKYLQVFAIWIPDEKRNDEAIDYFNNVRNDFISQINQNNKFISLCKTAKDIDDAFVSVKIAAVLSVESGAVLAGNIDNLDYIYDCGVRLVTLTWSGQNELGDGCFCKNAGALTDFGKAVVKKMQQKKMIVDVSHLSEKGFYDVAALSHRPFVASHSNCRSLIKNERGTGRNLSDEQINIIIKSGGLIGLNFCRDFLGDNGNDGRQALLSHILHFLELGAEKSLAFGCDYDGCEVNDELDGLDSILPLYEWLLSERIPQSILNEIFFENAHRFMIANI